MPIPIEILVPLLFGAASGVGAGLTSPNPYQERRSFAGTGTDPRSWLTEARGALTNTFNTAAARANEPIDLSGAQVQMPRRLQGGSMPLSVGLTAQPPAIGPSRVPLSLFTPMPVVPSGRSRPRGDHPQTGAAMTRSQPGTAVPRDALLPRRPSESSQVFPSAPAPGKSPLERALPGHTSILDQIIPGRRSRDTAGQAAARLLLISQAQRRG